MGFPWHVARREPEGKTVFGMVNNYYLRKYSLCRALGNSGAAAVTPFPAKHLCQIRRCPCTQHRGWGKCGREVQNRAARGEVRVKNAKEGLVELGPEYGRQERRRVPPRHSREQGREAVGEARLAQIAAGICTNPTTDSSRHCYHQ